MSHDLEVESRGRFVSLFHHSLFLVTFSFASRGRRGARDSRRDDHEVGGGEAGAEHRPPQGHREGWRHRALVGATSE
jgi:hypothetical protein